VYIRKVWKYQRDN